MNLTVFHILLYLAVLSLSNFCDGSNITEAEANRVEVKFYRLQVSEWTSGNMETTFHSLVASEANTYCTANLAACGLNSLASNFKESHIGKVDNSPVNDDKDMLYDFYIEYPNGANISSSSALQYVLSQSVVKSIILQLRTNVDYISQLNCKRCYITYIGDDFYGIPPASMENKIIIPLAFLVLLIIIIVAISLHCWDKKREKLRRWEKMNQPKPRTQIPPQYVMAGELPKKTNMPDEKMPEKKTRKDKMYGASGSPTKTFDRSGGASNDSGLDVEVYNDRSRAFNKPHALEPLDQDNEVKKKKKKKDKKHRSKRSTKVDGAENQGYMAEDEEFGKADMTTDL